MPFSLPPGSAACAAHGMLLSRGAMAEALGLAVETVSRHLTAFQQDGRIALSGLRGVCLLDRVRLAGIAG